MSLAIDNVGAQTASLCYDILSGSTAAGDLGLPVSDSKTQAGRLVPLAGAPNRPIDQSSAPRHVETLRVSFSTTFYAHKAASQRLLDRCTALLESGSLRPARTQFVEGGLEGIEKGLDDLRNGRVAGGYKLVACLADTKRI